MTPADALAEAATDAVVAAGAVVWKLQLLERWIG